MTFSGHDDSTINIVLGLLLLLLSSSSSQTDIHTDGRTDRQTDRPTQSTATYSLRDVFAWTWLKLRAVVVCRYKVAPNNCRYCYMSDREREREREREKRQHRHYTSNQFLNCRGVVGDGTPTVFGSTRSSCPSPCYSRGLIQTTHEGTHRTYRVHSAEDSNDKERGMQCSKNDELLFFVVVYEKHKYRSFSVIRLEGGPSIPPRLFFDNSYSGSNVRNI